MTSEESPEESGASDDVLADSAATTQDAASPHGNGPKRTMKDYLLEEGAAEFKLSPGVSQRIFSAMSPTMRLIAKQQTTAAAKALSAATHSGALRDLKVGQDALASLKVAGVRVPALEGFKTDFGISDRLREQMAASLPAARINAKFAPLQDSIARSVLPRFDFAGPKPPTSAFAKPYGRGWAPIASKLAGIQKLYDGIDFEQMFADWYPPNWDRDRGAEQYHDFLALAETETLPMTWVPNTELTYLLLDAESPEARDELLVEHAAVIVGDCRAVLDEFDNDTHLVTGLRNALDAYEAGFHGPAQSYAASILDTALREAFTAPKRWSYLSVKKLLHTGKDWQSLAMRSARLLPTSVALRGLLEDFWSDRGDAIPTRPNRHASAHAVHPDQYNRVNAIKFMMLTTAMLAEMEYDGWARILAAPAA